MSKLSNYLANQQDTATRIAGLLDALLCLKDKQEAKYTSEAEYAVTAMAHELAKELSGNLDCTSLPPEGAA